MSSKIKVLQVIPKLGYGGAETGCEEGLDPIDFVFEWSFDKEVYVGPGYQTLE